MVIEDRMLGNRSLRRPRSGTLDTLILEDGMYEDIKREAIEEDDTRTATANGRAPEREYRIECNPF